MAKLAHTAVTSIAVTVLVMNLVQRLRAFLLFWCRLMLSRWQNHLLGAKRFAFTG